MQAPRFWYGAGGRDAAPMLSALATPLSWVYAAATARRVARPAHLALPIPVVCVGNVSVGGVGKTPIVRALRAAFTEAGVTAHVVARGHGGRLRGPVRVAATHTAADVGDEPLLHARDGPAWIGRDRAAAAAMAHAAGAGAIVMDDGFQNPDLAKTLSILVFDADLGVGNGRVVPAGPLREPVAAGLRRADAVVLMGGQAGMPAPAYLHGFKGEILAAALAPAAAAPDGALVAFAGIGRPQKFFDTLQALGADVAEAVPFADHHAFSASDLAYLRKLAQERNARLIATEKDWVRLPSAIQTEVLTLPVVARFADQAAPARLIGQAIARAQAAR